MADSTLIKRVIEVQIQLGEGSFGETGANTVSITGLRVSAIITKVGRAGMTTCDCRIFGLPPTVVKAITTLGKVLTGVKKNVIKLLAGDEGGQAVVFIGIIQTAFQDYNSAPDVSVTIGAYEGILEAMRPLPPSSFPGGADVATIISGLAEQMGYGFENSGVSVQLSNQYLPGTGFKQAQDAATAANINIAFDDGTIAIWSKGKARGGTAIVVSPTTGMVGYPAWMEASIVVKSLYNPSFVFGAPIKVEGSFIENANGQWVPFKITHELDSEMPDGKWFSTLECSILDFQASA